MGDLQRFGARAHGSRHDLHIASGENRSPKNRGYRRGRDRHSRRTLAAVLTPGRRDLGGQLRALGAVTSIAFSFAYTRKFIAPLRLDPVGVAAGQVLTASVVSIGPMLMTDFSMVVLTPSVVVSVIIWGVPLILLSSRESGLMMSFGLVDAPSAEHGVEHVATSPCERDDGLVMAFALGDFPVVIGA